MIKTPKMWVMGFGIEDVKFFGTLLKVRKIGKTYFSLEGYRSLHSHYTIPAVCQVVPAVSESFSISMAFFMPISVR